MSLFDNFSIAGSGMSAQSVRLNTTASNLANAESVSSSTGDTYRARHPVFEAVRQQQLPQSGGGRLPGGGFDRHGHAGTGVQVAGVVESDAPLERKYEPNNPAANEDGYVFYPNVNVVEEMADMISASRSFQTNVEVMNTSKQMMQKAITLGQ